MSLLGVRPHGHPPFEQCTSHAIGISTLSRLLLWGFALVYGVVLTSHAGGACRPRATPAAHPPSVCRHAVARTSVPLARWLRACGIAATGFYGVAKAFVVRDRRGRGRATPSPPPAERCSAMPLRRVVVPRAAARGSEADRGRPAHRRGGSMPGAASPVVMPTLSYLAPGSRTPPPPPPSASPPTDSSSIHGDSYKPLLREPRAERDRASRTHAARGAC